MTSKRNFLLFICSVSFLFFKAQTNIPSVDSINRSISECKTDTCRIRKYVVFSERLVMNNLELSRDLSVKGFKMMELMKPNAKDKNLILKLQKFEILLFHVRGIQHSVGGNFDSAEVAFNKSLELAKLIGDKESEAGAYSDISEVKRKSGDYPTATAFALRSLKLKEDIRDTVGMAISYNNLGMIFRLKKEFEKSLEYHFKAIELKKRILAKINDSYSQTNLGYSYSNIANVYLGLEQPAKAIEFCEKAIGLYKKSSNLAALGGSYSNLGVMYEQVGDNDKALNCYLKALEIKEQAGNKEDLAASYINLGGFYSATDLKKGKEYVLKGYELAKISKFKEFEKGGAEALSELYALEGNYKKAYEYHLVYSDLKDSILGEESHLQITEMETKYETEKKEKENLALKNRNEVQKLEAEKKDAEIGKQRVMIGVSIIGLLFVAGLALFIFKNYKDKKKANEIITKQKEEVEEQKTLVESQKHIIEEKQKELLDSIHYAKRIQRALIPSEKYIQRTLVKLRSKKDQG